MRVVIADDEVLLRDGLDRLLTEAGFDVVGKAGTARELHREVELARPDVAIIDIKMPPTHTDEGLVAAQEIHASHPGVGVLVLSHFLESHYAMRLIQQHPGGAGYLLKERVSGVGVLADALVRVHEGECVIDPTIVSRLMRRARPASALGQLTDGRGARDAHLHQARRRRVGRRSPPRARGDQLPAVSTPAAGVTHRRVRAAAHPPVGGSACSGTAPRGWC